VTLYSLHTHTHAQQHTHAYKLILLIILGQHKLAILPLCLLTPYTPPPPAPHSSDTVIALFLFFYQLLIYFLVIPLWTHVSAKSYSVHISLFFNL